MTQSQMISIRGKDLYVEAVGPEDAPALLFLHGGPGGTGSYEFMLSQRELLSQHVRLIALDQRGVLRSEALTRRTHSPCRTCSTILKPCVNTSVIFSGLCSDTPSEDSSRPCTPTDIRNR